MNEAIKITPVAKKHGGTLRGSRYVSPPRKGDKSPEVDLGFGTKYAIYVHEMDENVNWSRPGSGPKFLERPMLSAKSGYVNRLAKRTQANYSAGVLMGALAKGEHPKKPRQTRAQKDRK
jgi:hypothetical protein